MNNERAKKIFVKNISEYLGITPEQVIENKEFKDISDDVLPLIIKSMKEYAAQAFEEGQKQILSDISKVFEENIDRRELKAASGTDVMRTLSVNIKTFPLSYNRYKNKEQ